MDHESQTGRFRQRAMQDSAISVAVKSLAGSLGGGLFQALACHA